MKNARSLLLAASTVALLVSACSQAPAGLDAPMLEPQFGSADNDFGQDVALSPTGDVYTLTKQTGSTYDEYSQNGKYDYVFLKHYSSSGSLVASKKIESFTCGYPGYGAYVEDCDFSFGLGVHELHSDAHSYTYALLSSSYVVDDSATTSRYSVYKLDASGRVVKTVAVGTTGRGFESSAPSDFLDVAVDKNGAIYVAKRQFDYDPYYESEPYTNVIAKYSSGGTLQWQRISKVGVPKAVTVSESGSVYVVGSSGISRYAGSGSLTWTKPGGGDDLTLSGSGLYVRQGTTIRKYDGSGTQVWAKTQRGLDSPVIADMTGDTGGNVYLAGKVATTSNSRDAFVRKLSPSGSVLWTKQYGTSKYDDTRGIATLDGSAIYTAGATQGSLAAKNLGGSDGYVRKVDGSGNRVWTR